MSLKLQLHGSCRSNSAFLLTSNTVSPTLYSVLVSSTFNQPLGDILVVVFLRHCLADLGRISTGHVHLRDYDVSLTEEVRDVVVLEDLKQSVGQSSTAVTLEPVALIADEEI
jgi:hypothetical protein